MASRFKSECLAILDQVDELKISVVVTKHGRPGAREERNHHLGPR